MIEVAALFITLGAVIYHSLHADLFTVSLASFSCAAVVFFAYRSRQGAVCALLLGALMMLGALAVWNAEEAVPKEIFGDRAFDVKVVSVDRRLTKTNLIVKEEGSDSKLQLAVDGDVAFLPGDRLSVRARIERPEAFLTDSGRVFDYPKYLESKGIVGIADSADVLLQEKGTFSLARVAAVARFRIADVFAKYVSFPVDGVIAGMTVGYQGALPTPIKDLFRDTGVLHVLVLSGYNITLLAGFLFLILRGLPFRLRTILIIVAIVLLVVISGSGIASVRAGIMGSIALLAGLALRTYQPLRALTLAYLIFFFISPTTIFSDPGFHLSFLATSFMVLVLPKIEGAFSFIPKTRGVNARELLMLAVSIPLFMLPYSMYFAGAFPLASPLANILLALMTPLLMVLGIAVVVLSFLAPFASLLGSVASGVGAFVVRILETLSFLPVWQTPAIPWWAVAGVYGALFWIFFRKEISSYVRQLGNSLQPASNSFDP